MTATITEIERLRRELAAAEEELAAWRAMTSDDADLLTRRAHLIKAAYPRMQGFAPALFLAALHASSRPVSYSALDDLVPPKQSQDRVGRAVMNTICCHARNALGKDRIVTIRAYGYALSSQGRAELDAVIAE